MNKHTLAELLAQRWAEAVAAFPPLKTLQTGWVFGESLHFTSPRGYAVSVFDGPVCYLKFALKILDAPLHRVDAIVRHEIGHLVDFSGLIELPPSLPTTPERRADSIAELIWGQTIKYDAEFVQTLEEGTNPRPEHLGL